MDSEKFANAIIDSLKLYLESLDKSCGYKRSQESVICSNCQNIVSFEFMALSFAQSKIITCTCGEKVIVRYSP